METISVSERLLQELRRVDECEGCGALGVKGEFEPQGEDSLVLCQVCVDEGPRTDYVVGVEFSVLDSERFRREELGREVMELVAAFASSVKITLVEVY